MSCEGPKKQTQCEGEAGSTVGLGIAPGEPRLQESRCAWVGSLSNDRCHRNLRAQRRLRRRGHRRREILRCAHHDSERKVNDGVRKCRASNGKGRRGDIADVADIESRRRHALDGVLLCKNRSTARTRWLETRNLFYHAAQCRTCTYKRAASDDSNRSPLLTIVHCGAVLGQSWLDDGRGFTGRSKPFHADCALRRSEGVTATLSSGGVRLVSHFTLWGHLSFGLSRNGEEPSSYKVQILGM
jgi:hypothetical protein